MDVFEVKLGDKFLMSSLFTDGEVALANRGLEALNGQSDKPADVVIGGLGLGYTAYAALSFQGVNSVVIVEVLVHVIEWHKKGLVPLGEKLVSDPRCRFVHGNFSLWRVLRARVLIPTLQGAGSTLFCWTLTIRRKTCSIRITPRFTHRQD